MKTNPNDAVSPCKVYEESGSDVLGDVLIPKPGLTKREYYAGLAMQSMADNDEPIDEIAKQAVALADALIIALNESSTKD